MLINTVVMFLRELLPALLLLSTVLVWHRTRLRPLAISLVPLTVLGLVLLSGQYGRLSGALDGLGLEFFYLCCYLLCFVLLLAAVICQRHRQHAALLSGAAVTALLWVNGSNLVLFLFVYERQWFQQPVLWLGVILGLGIGLSVAVLWHYLLRELTHWRGLLSSVLALLATRQLTMAAALALQSDWIPAGPVLWDSQQWLSEQSEYGYFFNALLGYEATPALAQCVAFALGLLLMIWQGRRLEVQ
jgi:high-affinity iron transporter